MSTNKKDVHRTGALASLLDKNDIKRVDLSAPSVQEQVVDAVIKPNEMASLAKRTHTPQHVQSHSIIEIDTDQCQPWRFADRSDLEMGNIEELANSIKQAGQQEPALIRPLPSSNTQSSIRYEVIFGNRRWKACKLIGKKLYAVIKHLDDQEAALAQKEENEHRKDISDYSKATSYKNLIDSGVFSNENQLAQKLNIPRNRLNDLLSYTRIPKTLIEVIPNIHNLAQRMAIKLAALAKDPENLALLIQSAEKIGTNKITSTNIEKILNDMKSGHRATLSKSTPVIGKGGAEIFTIREDSNGAPCIVLHKVARRVVNIDDLGSIIKEYIDKCVEENLTQDTTS